MKILFLCRSLNVGGVENNILLLSKELIAASHQIYVGAEEGVLCDEIIKTGAHYEHFHFALRRINLLVEDAVHLHRFIKNIQPDIIHVFSAAPGVAIKLTKFYHRLCFAKTKFPPVVSSVMGLQSSPDEPIFKTQIRNFFVTLGAKRVFIISPAIRMYLEKLPFRRNRLKDLNVVGIKIPLFPIIDKSLLKQSLGIPVDNRVIMTIGRLSPAKSHELFIDAASLLLQRQKNITFLIVGIGPLQENLQSLILNKNAVSNIKLLGLRTDVYNLLSICDVYVKPGIVEGFIGITVLEAQAMGVPVVAWYTGDVTLAIEDGKTGCIIKNVDVGAMAQTMEMMLNDRNRAMRIGENGSAFVTKTFTIEGIARDLVKAYEQEISGDSMDRR